MGIVKKVINLKMTKKIGLILGSQFGTIPLGLADVFKGIFTGTKISVVLPTADLL